MIKFKRFKRFKRFKINSGQALVEVLFAVGVVGLCLVALIAAVVAAVRNARFAKNSALAAQYAQEGIEVARQARDEANSWDEFTSNFSGSKGLDSNLNWNGCDNANVGIFTRCVDFVNNGDRSTVTVTVSWDESGRHHETQAVTFLTKWSK